MEAHSDIRKKSHSTIIVMLAASALLPLLLNSAGVVAGFVLAVIILAWLLRASDADIKNRIVLLTLSVLVLLMNGAFLIGVITNGTWEF